MRRGTWKLGVDVVVDERVVLAWVRAVQTPSVLRDGSLPSYRHSEEERVMRGQTRRKFCVLGFDHATFRKQDS